MAAISQRLAALALLLALGVAGCGRQTAAPGGAAEKAKAPIASGPGEIELSDPKVTFTEPNIVRFEVSYRFTKGQPDRYYMCDISFPGTANHGAKPMDSWELKPAGVIKDGITLSKPPVEKFEIRVSEAVSPQDGYKQISNVVSGVVK